MKRLDRTILAIDLKSFYASVECIERHLDPFTTPLVVADESRGDGTIVLAASPFIREKYGVKSRCRLYEVDKNIPGLVIARPHMKLYLEKSAQINSIYLDYVSEDDLHVYSIDESFLDVTHYLKRGNDTPMSYARKIIEEVRSKTGLSVTCGIGKNLFMAKCCMDIEAKKSPEFLSQWDYSDIPEHLWPIAPLSKIWGIGTRLEKKLNDLGFFQMGDIAVSDPSFLKSKLGVIGEEIYWHSLGYDDALIQEHYEPLDKSFSVGEVLLRDYRREEMGTVINDLAIELSDRLHLEEKLSSSFVLCIGYKDGRGYCKKSMFYTPTDSASKISKALRERFYEDFAPMDTLYRKVNLVALDVIDRDCYQGSLFEDYGHDSKERILEETMIGIRRTFGALKAMPCSALTKASTFIQRSQQIGGHHR